MKDETLIILIGIICITLLEICALLSRIDGQIFLSSLGAITGVIGYFYGKKKEKDKYLRINE